MAESFTRAFGRYLKTLRERRGLSLDDVVSLSQSSPERLNKGYLSRCENGHQKLAFPKVVPLSRIYQVEPDVLLERIELDMDLDRLGGPDTEGLSYRELTDAGKASYNQGYHVVTYGYFRDAVIRAPVDPVGASFQSAEEQVAIALMGCASAARTLGRYRYALHEYLFLEKSEHFGPRHRPIILDRVAATLRAVGRPSEAESYAEAALKAALAHGDREFLGFLYLSRGVIALDVNGPREGAKFFHKAYAAFKAVGKTSECGRSLLNLAQCFFDLKRYGAARRSLDAALRISLNEKQLRCQALSLILLGEIEELANKHDLAGRRWKEAAAIARRLSDKQLRFKADFLLYRRARMDDQVAIARSIERRLRKLSVWIPANTHELGAFRRLADAPQSTLKHSA